MKISWLGKAGIPAKTDLVIVPYLEGKKGDALRAVDALTGGAVSKRARKLGFKGQKGKFLYVQDGASGKAQLAVLCFGVSHEELGPDKWRLAVGKAVGRAPSLDATSVCVLIDGKESRLPGLVRLTTEAVVMASYKFDLHKTKRNDQNNAIAKIVVGAVSSKVPEATLRSAFKAGQATGQGVNLARDLVNEPANVLSPRELAARATQIAKGGGLQITVLDEKQIKRKNMNLLLSVAAGSERPPRFIHAVYKPSKKATTKIALVGKGVTFDSGGLCVKPAKPMYDMKTDMAGSAVVLGVLSALPDLAPNVEVHCIVPTTDNAINGDATRPGDVIKSMSGTTVEILNTDAEGRLILADALAYAESLKPDAIIDFATLTGACVVALGDKCAGVMSPDDHTVGALLKAAEDAGELMWRLPLLDDQEQAISSDVADVKNIGGPYGGAISAGQFLRKFVKDTPWVHVDIAGPARSDSKTSISPKGGTGFGVISTLKFLSNLS